MKAFRQLCRVTALRTLRDPVTVVFSLAFAPVFIIVMGLIFGNDPTPQFGGRGFLEANFTAFPGIVIAITSAIMVPVDMASQRSAGVLRRFRATPLQPGPYLAADVVSRLVLTFASIAAMYAVVILGFGVRPASVGALARDAPGHPCSGWRPSWRWATCWHPASGPRARRRGWATSCCTHSSSPPAPPCRWPFCPRGCGSAARFSPLTPAHLLSVRALWGR